MVVDARRVALLAATGHADALVRTRPRVAVVSTGAELVPPGEPLRPGQIHESNSYMLEAAIVASGAVAVRQATVDDDAAAVLAAVAELAADVDAIVTSGGVSMGAYDVVKESLRDHGVDFVQVAMQPGKPQGFGLVGDRRVPALRAAGQPGVARTCRSRCSSGPRCAGSWACGPRCGRPSPRGWSTPSPRRPGARRWRERWRRIPSRAGGPTRSGGRPHTSSPTWRGRTRFVFVPPDVTRVEAGDDVEIWLLDEPGAG